MELYTGEKDCKGNDKPPQCTQCIQNHVPNEDCQHLFDGGLFHDLRELDFDELHNVIFKDLPDRVCPHKWNLLKPLISLFLKRFFF
jgi:hypothetical protein